MKKEELLEAALRVYLRNPNATVHEVAEEAGVSKSTIFYYFKNKNGLEKELLLYAIEKFSPWKASSLEEAIKRRFQIMKEYPGLAKMFYTLLDNLSKNDPKFVEEIRQRSFSRIAKILEKEGFKDCYDLAIFLLASLDGIALYSIYMELDFSKFERMILEALRRLKDEI